MEIFRIQFRDRGKKMLRKLKRKEEEKKLNFWFIFSDKKKSGFGRKFLLLIFIFFAAIALGLIVQGGNNYWRVSPLPVKKCFNESIYNKRRQCVISFLFTNFVATEVFSNFLKVLFGIKLLVSFKFKVLPRLELFLKNKLCVPN